MSHRKQPQEIGVAFLAATFSFFASFDNGPRAGEVQSVSVEDFETYATNADLAKAWYRPPHGGGVTQSLTAETKSHGKFGLKFHYETTRSNDKFYSALCRVAKWNVSGQDAFQIWLQPDGSGRKLTIEFNVADANGQNIHDLWDYPYPLARDDRAPRLITIPFSKLIQNSKYATAKVRTAFDPAGVIEVAFYIGGRQDEPGVGDYYLDNLIAIRTDGAKAPK